MSDIDEKALHLVIQQAGICDKEAITKLIFAYESAKTPRTISVEEFKEAAYAAGIVFVPSGIWNIRESIKIQAAVKATLATLGITVEGD